MELNKVQKPFRQPTEEHPLNKEEQVYEFKEPDCHKNALLYFRDFSVNASLDGLKFVGEKGRSMFERIFWAVTLIIALGLCIILVVQTFEKWINSPVLVSFATTQTPIFEIPFPSITICPEIKARKSIFNFTDVYIKKLNEEELSVNETIGLEYMSLVCDTDSDLLKNYSNKTDNSALDYLTMVAPDYLESVFEIQWRAKKLTNNASELFVPIITSEGVCFSFNVVDHSELFSDIVAPYKNYFSTNGKKSEWSPENGYNADSNLNSYPRRTLIAGTKGGLSIVLKVSGDDLDYACGDSMQGFKVTLHHPASVPRVKQNYFRIPLDQAVVAAVKPNMMTTSEALRDYKPEDRKCYFVSEKYLKYFKIYNQENCLIECLANYTIDKCGCSSFHLPREEITPICGASSKDCTERAKVKFLATEVSYKIRQNNKNAGGQNATNLDFTQRCDCLPSCFSLDFDVETSQADWDWREAVNVLRATDFGQESEDQMLGSKPHLMRLEISFKDMQFITSERNELYGYVDFWANVGGVIGLFTGFSFITMFEVIYYLTLRLTCNLRMFGTRYWSGDDDLLIEVGIRQKPV